MSRDVEPNPAQTKGRAASLSAFLAVAILALAGVDLVLSSITPLAAETAPVRRAAAERGLDADLSILTRKNIFEGAPESEGPLIPENDLPVTTLQLKLKSAVPGQGAESLAIIELPSAKQELFSEGDTIMRGVRLERVELYRVVISRSGVQEALLLENRPDRPTDIPISSGIFVEGGGEADEAVTTDPTPQLELSGQSLASIQQSIEAGAPLSEVAGPAFVFLQRFGAEASDIPIAINGQDMEDVSDSWSMLFQKAQRDGSITLTVRRNGAIENITVEVPTGLNL